MLYWILEIRVRWGEVVRLEVEAEMELIEGEGRYGEEGKCQSGTQKEIGAYSIVRDLCLGLALRS